MGFATAGVAYTTGEITAFMPATGGFIRHATKFVEPALGAATGWNFCELVMRFFHHQVAIADLSKGTQCPFQYQQRSVLQPPWFNSGTIRSILLSGSQYSSSSS